MQHLRQSCVVFFGLALLFSLASCSSFKSGEVNEDDATKAGAAGRLAGRLAARGLNELKADDRQLALNASVAAQNVLVSTEPSFTAIEAALAPMGKPAGIIAEGVTDLREVLILFDVDITDAIEPGSVVHIGMSAFFDSLIKGIQVVSTVSAVDSSAIS